MTTLIFVLTWVLLGLGLLFVALSGGAGGAGQRLMSTGRGARRAAAVLFALALILLGVGVPAAVIAAVSNDDSIPEANVSNLTASEKHGRELFGVRCVNCHTLEASNAIAEIGPNLDQLRPGPDLVTRQVNSGGGAMPSFKGKLTDAQIKQVADYVSANAGKS